ncbi:hypothetical protein P3H15_50580 [Rhodococcus sp. T2V]|uniref:hypothetical protein n=1 Tax=Rhodococcus sp. T2V TaxID=3034164 RepID=UPI0023E330BF|nr:hypothetical protein [Rhodococcus sp. T2V]MDF3313169.1 hypothetical protein [Rhodococcus sp. T2V]
MARSESARPGRRLAAKVTFITGTGTGDGQGSAAAQLFATEGAVRSRFRPRPGPTRGNRARECGLLEGRWSRSAPVDLSNGETSRKWIEQGIGEIVVLYNNASLPKFGLVGVVEKHIGRSLFDMSST